MTDRELLDLVATIDRWPVTTSLPDGWSGEDVVPLDSHDQKETPMSVIEDLKPVSPPARPPRRSGGLVAAAIALIAAIAAVVLLTNSADDTIVEPTTTSTLPPVTTEAERLAVAEAITAAYYSLDADALVAAVGTPSVPLSALLDSQANERVLNAEITLSSGCAEGSARIVECRTTTSNDVMTALGTDTTDGIRVSFTGSGVLGVTKHTDGRLIFEHLLTWVDDNHPEASLSNCAPGDDALRACWETIIELLPEFVASDEYTAP